jgi:predicted ribosomally synthesized peptide with SipW-like signal peptide
LKWDFIKQNYIKKFILPGLFLNLLLVGTTSAYLTDVQKCENLFQTGENESRIVEDFPEPQPESIDENPQYTKTIWVENTSSGTTDGQMDCYVRLSLSYSDYDVAKGLTLLGLNTSDWIYDSKDGYYYYNKALAAGEQTSALCTGFQIDSEKVPEECKKEIREFSIYVYEETVLANSFDSYQAAWDYYENPVKNS